MEVNIPIVRNFFELLHSHVLDLCSRNKHRLVRRIWLFYSSDEFSLII